MKRADAVTPYPCHRKKGIAGLQKGGARHGTSMIAYCNVSILQIMGSRGFEIFICEEAGWVVRAQYVWGWGLKEAPMAVPVQKSTAANLISLKLDGRQVKVKFFFFGKLSPLRCVPQADRLLLGILLRHAC